MLKAIIIDDEEMGRIALREKLTHYCTDVEVIGYAEDGTTGLQLIESSNPDIVFLDIEMPIMGGFEMLSQLKDQSFHLIFTTAYDQYAIKAIRFAAFDYLLKPIDIDELKQAVSRIQQETIRDTREKLEVLRHNLQSESVMDKIAVPTLEGLLFLTIENIVHLEADGNYTTIYLSNGTKEVTSRTLKDYEDLLPKSLFFRCHHSHLVNLKTIKRYIKGDGGQIELENGHYVAVSRRKKDDFLSKFKSL